MNTVHDNMKFYLNGEMRFEICLFDELGGSSSYMSAVFAGEQGICCIGVATSQSL